MKTQPQPLTTEQESALTAIAEAHSLQTHKGWNAAIKEARKALPRAAQKAALIHLNRYLAVQIYRAITMGQAVTLSHSNSGSVTSIITLEQLPAGLIVRQRYLVANKDSDGTGDCVYEYSHPMVAQLEALYGFRVADGRKALAPIP
jgi:hypothetical protein